VLAASEIPQEYLRWNRLWHAPFGRSCCKLIPRHFRAQTGIAQLCGLFAMQPNNDTRVFEYPWVSSMLQAQKDMQILEIGGGVSGMQFMLDRVGCHVTNVDPGIDAHGKGWPVTIEKIATLNRYFCTGVELKNCFIEEAGILDEKYDRVFSISTIEHIPEDDIKTILQHVQRALKPRGLFIVTLDLFLNIEPFAVGKTNRYGKNVSAKWLVEQSGLSLVHGNRAELYGFPEFDPKHIYINRHKYLVGSGYPAMVQAMVLQK